MIEEKNKDKERIIFQKDICPECHSKMSQIGKVYRCFKCGIIVEL